MKKKGFTLVELLVVIAIIALLMGILMPALARVRQIAYRLYCGTNLSGIGKAMLIYANDYEDELPRAGLSGSPWVKQVYYGQPLPADAFKDGASITSCFYLLIKYSEVTPKSFLCKGDSDISEFSDPRDLVNLHDFGGDPTDHSKDPPQEHCSYAYHNPFIPSGSVGYGMTSSSDPGMAVAADPNPWQFTYATDGRQTWSQYVFNGNREQTKKGNAETHQFDGQNVLFVDGHTTFEKKSNCGVDNDNIYTVWTNQVIAAGKEEDRQKGTPVGEGASTIPKSRNDSVLVTDGDPAPQR